MNNNSDSTSEHINLRLSTKQSPLRINLVLINMAEYLDWESLKSCREVCSTWNEAFALKFRKQSQMKADLSSTESSAELESQFAASSKINALRLIINPEENFMYPFLNNWLSSFGPQLTRLTLENSENSQFKKISDSFGELFEYCSNIKYLTLVNLKLHNGSYLDSQFKNIVPRINLNELTIKSTALETEPPRITVCRDLIPCGFASHLLSIHTINVEFKSNSGGFIYIINTPLYCNEVSRAFKLFKNAVHLTFKNTLEETDKTKYLSMCDLEFPNLERLQYSSNGSVVFNKNDVVLQFPKLEWLNVSICSARHINYYHQCPNLIEIELSEDVKSSFDEYIIDAFAHPNVQALKVNLRAITSERIFNFFPNLKRLHVDLTGGSLMNQLAIFSTHSTLKELTIIENSSTEEFENAMENHFSSLLQGLKKLYIQTLNTEERSPSLLNIFTQKVANAPVAPTLTSVTLRGFKISCQQYDYVKHQLPFYLLIL